MERVFIFKPDSHVSLTTAADTVNGHLKEGWSVKDVITGEGIVVFVLNSPEPDDDDDDDDDGFW